MVKFFKLLRNENKKELKKISTKIFIGVAIFTIILAVMFTAFIGWLNRFGNSIIDNSWKESLQFEIDDSIKHDLFRAKEMNDEISVKNIEARLKIYELAMENDINVFSLTKEWKSMGLEELVNKTCELKLYYYIDENNIIDNTGRIDELFTLIKNDDYSGYMQIIKQWLKEDLDKNIITKEEYDILEADFNLKEKYEIGKTNDSSWKLELVNEIKNIQEQLDKNMNTYTKKVFTYEQKEQMENRLKIDLYRLDNNISLIGTGIDETNYREYFDSFAKSFSMLVLSILVIMMAGSSIASEYSKGTIKFLCMTPYKRWKILLAKFINIVFIMVVVTIILSVITIIVGNLLYSSSEANPYLYVKDGEVCELDHNIYTLLNFLVEDIEIFVYLVFALMLSVVTRNTAVSIGASIGTYLGNGIAMTLINMFIKSEWIKFIPFNNFNLSNRIFTDTMIMMPEGTSDIVSNIPVVFSIAVLGVCSILMVVTMFDSFNKKDIK